MGIPKYHGKYICKCASRFCTNSLNISKNNNKIKFYISNSRHENNMHLIIEPEKIPQILKDISNLYNKIQEEQGKPGRLEITTTD